MLSEGGIQHSFVFLAGISKILLGQEVASDDVQDRNGRLRVLVDPDQAVGQAIGKRVVPPHGAQVVLADCEAGSCGRVCRGYTVLRHVGFLDLVDYGCGLADGSSVPALGPSLFLRFQSGWKVTALSTEWVDGA